MLSKNAHPVAVLRKILGLRQKEFASLIGVATVTVQKIEIKKRRLTPDLAMQIGEQTGVKMEWLLAGDPKTAPVNRRGSPYRSLDFEKTQAAIRSSVCDGASVTIDISVEGGDRAIMAWSMKEMIELHLGGAGRKGSYAFNMLCFRLDEFLRTQSRLLKLDTIDQHETMISERQVEIEMNRQRPRRTGTLKNSGPIGSGPSKEMKWHPETAPDKKPVSKTATSRRKKK